MNGFFDLPTQSKSVQPKTIRGAIGCDACGLHKKVLSPKIPPTGEGLLRTLIIGEAPGETEDKLNNAFVGDTGHFLRKCFRTMGYDLDRDFWKTNAVACRTATDKGTNRTPTTRELKACEFMWRSAIQKYQPKYIILFGAKAVEAFFMNRTQPISTNLSIGRWRKLCIPDVQIKAWIIPLYHPSFVIRNPDAESIFKLDLKWAMEQINSNLPDIEEIDYSQKIKCLTNVDEVLNLLKTIKDQKPTIAFDYETTGIRPYFPGHSIVSTAVAIYGEDLAYSFPGNYPGAWESGQLDRVNTAWRRVLSDPDILKVAQNIQMEHPWSKIIIGEEPKGWYWDTMVFSHIVDERPQFTGLDFQTFINWGYEYGGEVSKYKKAAPGTKFNSMQKCPLNELLKYNGLDAYFTMRLAEKQWDFLDKGNKESEAASRAYDLFHKGILTFSDMEMTGITVNTEYYQDTQVKLEKRLSFLEKQLLRTSEANLFKSKMGRDINLGSPDDLKKLFFDYLGIKSVKRTEKDNESVDKDVLESLDLPFAKNLVKKRQLDKLKTTYIDGILELQVDKKLHSNFNLHLVRTYRSSCIAKGTIIEVVRDVSKFSKGIPIEDIKEGDFVYCYDNNLKPAIRKVLWAGKTGVKKVIRIHWQSGQKWKKRGYLDLTPEHLVRTVSGKYVEAQNLLKFDLRGANQSKKSPKFSVLSMGRTTGDDRVYFTGNIPIADQVLVYDQLIEKLELGDIVHHKDENHFNNIPNNLEKRTKNSHCALHMNKVPKETLRLRGTITMKKLHKEGKITYKIGKENHNYKKISRYQLLKLLVIGKGVVTGRKEFDFSTFKYHSKLEKIDLFVVKSRWDRNGKFISKNKLINILKQGPSAAIELLGFNYYKTQRLSKIYGVYYQRKWGNQFGSFTTKNHIIIKIEDINLFSEVYDIQVEEFSNFIANEICVHNSDSPNLQNIPKRDKEAMIMVRGGMIPSPGNIILAADYGGHEVGIIACYSKDKVLMKEREQGADIHQEWSDFLQLSGFDAKTHRFDAKNAFVFAEFYGSYFKNIHADLVSRGYHDLPMMRVQKAEQEFWKKYKGVKKFQEELINSYKRNGYVEMMHGFRRRGFLKKNEIINTVIQGTAFHCLLESCNRLNDLRIKEEWKSKWIGEIHDEILGDIHPDELKYIANTTKRVMTEDILKNNPWICIPLISEISVTEIDGPWHTKKDYSES